MSTKPYCKDVVPILSSFMGGAADAKNLAGLIVRFSGYVLTDWEYAKFRAQVMRLVHEHMSWGCEGVDVIQARLNHTFLYNETRALWLIDDLTAWGFCVRSWFLEDGDTDCFMSVYWSISGTAPPRRSGMCLELPTSEDETE